MDAFGLADVEDVSPWDALKIAVNRRAARVKWVDSVINTILVKHRNRCDERSAEYDFEYAANHDPTIPPNDVRQWLVESRNEERLLTRASKLAIDAGVADALVRRWQIEGKLMVESLVAGLDALELTQEQRLAALDAAARQLALGETDVPSGRTQLRMVDATPTSPDDATPHPGLQNRNDNEDDERGDEE